MKNLLNKTISTTIMGSVLAAGLMSASPAMADNFNPSGPAYETGYANHQGAKKSVAVAKFDANGSFVANYGGWDVGGGLAAILVSELEQAGSFRVVNRSDMDAILYEQSLGAKGLTAANTNPTGQLVGAQFLIRGSVTEFNMNKKGGGISLGGNFGGVLGSLSPQKRKGKIAIDISVINATTGEVVDSITVSRKIKRTAIAANVAHRDFSVGADGFENSVLGEVARDAIAEAVSFISNSLAGQAWTAQVAQVSGTTLYVNAGADAGLRAGDRLIVSRTVERIVDPATGALLGLEQREVGTAIVTEVKGQYAKASYRTAIQPLTGDVLTLDGRGYASAAYENNVQVSAR